MSGLAFVAVVGSSDHFRPVLESLRAWLVVVVSLALLVGGCGSSDDPESSFEATLKVHNDLTAIFTEELRAEPASATANFAESEVCDGLFGLVDAGSDRALRLHSTWTVDQD